MWDVVRPDFWKWSDRTDIIPYHEQPLVVQKDVVPKHVHSRSIRVQACELLYPEKERFELEHGIEIETFKYEELIQNTIENLKTRILELSEQEYTERMQSSLIQQELLLYTKQCRDILLQTYIHSNWSKVVALPINVKTWNSKKLDAEILQFSGKKQDHDESEWSTNELQWSVDMLAIAKENEKIIFRFLEETERTTIVEYEMEHELGIPYEKFYNDFHGVREWTYQTLQHLTYNNYEENAERILPELLKDKLRAYSQRVKEFLSIYYSSKKTWILSRLLKLFDS